LHNREREILTGRDRCIWEDAAVECVAVWVEECAVGECVAAAAWGAACPGEAAV